MNFKNKKTILFLTVFVMLLVGLSVASATNVTKTSDKVSKKSVDTSKAVKNFVVDKKVVKNTTKESIKTATSKTKTKITISNVKKQYEVKDQLQVKAKLTDNKNKALKNQYLTVKVNKDSYKVKTDKKGVATSKNITLSKVGKYIITANFAGTKKYAASKATKTTKTTKMTTKILSEDSNYNYKNNYFGGIYFDLFDKNYQKIEETHPLYVKINNKEYLSKIEGGRFSPTLWKNNISFIKYDKNNKLEYHEIKLNKNNNIELEFKGNKVLAESKKTFKLNFGKKIHTVSELRELKPEYMLGESVYIYHYVEYVREKAPNSTSYVFVNGKKYKSSLNSWFIYNITKAGTYKVSAKYPGSSKFYSSSTVFNRTFKVVDYPLKLTLNKVLPKNNVNEKMLLTANVQLTNGYDVKTGKVHFKINNKVYKVKVKDGKATLKYKPTKTGNYNVMVKYVGIHKNIKKINTTQKFKVGKNILKHDIVFNISDYYKDVTSTLNQRIYINIQTKNPYTNEYEKPTNFTFNMTFNGKKYQYSLNEKEKTKDNINYTVYEHTNSYGGYIIIPASKLGRNVLLFTWGGNKYKTSSKTITYTVTNLSNRLPYTIKISEEWDFIEYDYEEFTDRDEFTIIYAQIYDKNNEKLSVNGSYNQYQIKNGKIELERIYEEEEYDYPYYHAKINLTIENQNYFAEELFFFGHNQLDYNDQICKKNSSIKTSEFPLTLNSSYLSEGNETIKVYLDRWNILLKTIYVVDSDTVTLVLNQTLINKIATDGIHVLEIEHYDEDEGESNSVYYGVNIKN